MTWRCSTCRTKQEFTDDEVLAQKFACKRVAADLARTATDDEVSAGAACGGALLRVHAAKKVVDELWGIVAEKVHAPQFAIVIVNDGEKDGVCAFHHNCEMGKAAFVQALRQFANAIERGAGEKGAI